ncbi:hypothetical protein LOK49_LG04G01578 [Camellia lanceoleosa]|uniref:Uncharacterized protein n=1 Tax=Camellia lanceoleosa TaxID=1840588 RepID=A0ACC0I695_9ERIC|nr:hypothetical protein LOK49_LG04G01578 [Camellia lanceoleosa]
MVRSGSWLVQHWTPLSFVSVDSVDIDSLPSDTYSANGLAWFLVSSFVRRSALNYARPLANSHISGTSSDKLIIHVHVLSFCLSEYNMYAFKKTKGVQYV